MNQEKQGLLTSQPVGVSRGPVLDDLTRQKLAAVDKFALQQGNALGEFLSAGCCANQYLVADENRTIEVPGAPPEKATIHPPLWIVQEESDPCKRCCCCGQHPMLAKFYHAAPPVAGSTNCCGCYRGHVFAADPSHPVTMTLERDGCCNKWIGCWICGPKCQSEAWLHAGNVDGQPGSIGASSGALLGRSVVPLQGNCFTPKLHIMQSKASMPPGYTEVKADPLDGADPATESHFADMVGPCVFGGCLDLCTDTVFAINRPRGDPMGAVIKQKPKGCWQTCIECMTDVDNYSLALDEPKINAEEKANLLGSMVHLDYWFFQRDTRPVQVRQSGDGKGGVIIITLFNWYCKGCVIPCQICVPYGRK